VGGGGVELGGGSMRDGLMGLGRPCLFLGLSLLFAADHF